MPNLFVRTETWPGGLTSQLWPEGGWLEYVDVAGVPMMAAFNFTAEPVGRPGIRLELRIRVIDHAPECVGVRLVSSRDDAPLTAAVLRGVDLDEWVQTACSRAHKSAGDATESIETDPDGMVWFLPGDAAQQANDAARKAARRARKAKGSYSNELLRKVASVYETNVDAFPTKAVRESFMVAQSTAALYVKKARERGFITAKAPKGGRP